MKIVDITKPSSRFWHFGTYFAFEKTCQSTKAPKHQSTKAADGGVTERLL